MSRASKAAVGRVLLLLAITASAIVAACGGGGGELLTPGGGDNPPPVNPPAATSVVTGTAASGAAIANVVVTLKDSTNRAVTATTATSGAFSLNTSDLTPPFVLQLSLPSGRPLFSVSTDANRTATINITPLTDIVVRTWFGMNGQTADSGFADPSAVPPPAPAQVRAIAQVLLNTLQLPITANAAPIGDPLDLIAKPFAADGTGIDKLLDNTRTTVRSDGVDLVLTAGSATQTTALAFNTSTSAITASSTTVQGSATTTSQSTDVVPVQGAQLTALELISARLAEAAATINSKGAAITAADLEPFFDANLLHGGRNRAQFLAETVGDFQRGVTPVTMTAERIRSLDLSAGKAEVLLRLTLTVGAQTQVDRDTFFFTRGSDGQWRFSGDGRVAAVNVQAEGRRNQGTFTGDNGPSINADVRAPEGVVTSGTVSGGTATLVLGRGATEVLAGQRFDSFFANTGPITTTPLPAAGQPISVALTTAASGTVTYTVPLNAFTTELIQITSPTATTFSTGPLTVTWTLPTTYAVQTTQLSVHMFTGPQTSPGSLECIVDTPVAASASSGTVTIAATCESQPVVEVNLNVATNGVNGERSMVVYSMTLP